MRDGSNRLVSLDEARLDTHEAVCAERYGKIIEKIDAAVGRIGRLELLVMTVAGTVIVSMGGLIITLALRGHS